MHAYIYFHLIAQICVESSSSSLAFVCIHNVPVYSHRIVHFGRCFIFGTLFAVRTIVCSGEQIVEKFDVKPLCGYRFCKCSVNMHLWAELTRRLSGEREIRIERLFSKVFGYCPWQNSPAETTYPQPHDNNSTNRFYTPNQTQSHWMEPQISEKFPHSNINKWENNSIRYAART